MIIRSLSMLRLSPEVALCTERIVSAISFNQCLAVHVSTYVRDAGLVRASWWGIAARQMTFKSFATYDISMECCWMIPCCGVMFC
jgi:hypothetical protein